MKHARKYVAAVLSIIIAVAAFPTTTHAAGIEGTDKSSNVTVDGINYSISQTDQTIKVTAREKGKIVDSCTAYLDQGYMLYKNKRTSKTSSTISSVSWLDDVMKESNPSKGSRMAAPAYTSWTKDGKYVYNPTQTSLFPKAYKSHTAYYWFRTVGTQDKPIKINVVKGMAVSQAVALVVAAIAAVATCGMAAAEVFAISFVFGESAGVIVDGVVNQTISPTVQVHITNYESKFTDASGASSGSTFKGSKIKVIGPASDYHSDVFYKQYCPQVSQKFGQTAFLNTFKGKFIKYPGVKYYVEL